MGKRVVVVAHDPAWGRMFEEAARDVAGALGGNVVEVHHIGGTSVAGLWAKPIIDMMPVVRSLGEVDGRSAEMERLGYEVMGEFGIAGRRYFRRDDAREVRTHQVHVFEVGSGHVGRHLAFRDFLRGHRAVARKYGELKRRLAEAHPTDIEAYMDGKDGFIKEVERRAVEWAGDRHEWCKSCGVPFVMGAMITDFIAEVRRRGLRRTLGLPYREYEKMFGHEPSGEWPDRVAEGDCDSVFMGDVIEPNAACPKCGGRAFGGR